MMRAKKCAVLCGVTVIVKKGRIIGIQLTGMKRKRVQYVYSSSSSSSISGNDNNGNAMYTPYTYTIHKCGPINNKQRYRDLSARSDRNDEQLLCPCFVTTIIAIIIVHEYWLIVIHILWINWIFDFLLWLLLLLFIFFTRFGLKSSRFQRISFYSK